MECGVREIYATTKYIYIHIPDDAIDEKLVAVDVGYSGSSNNHYYRSFGATAGAACLSRRERSCGCQPCLKLQPACTVTLKNVNLEVG